MVNLAEQISTALRKKRVALGLTQADAAEKIGITVEFYSRIERGAALPSLDTFVTIAVTFGVSTDTLIGLTEDEVAQQIINKYTPATPDEPPDVRRLKRQISEATPETRRVMAKLLNELEKLPHEVEAKKRKSGDKKAAQDEDEGEDQEQDQGSPSHSDEE